MKDYKEKPMADWSEEDFKQDSVDRKKALAEIAEASRLEIETQIAAESASLNASTE